jgi:glycosyltransferase involved in cell wall biosynthesis
MKISWVHDYKLSQWLGGAQLTNEYMINTSPYEVETFYPQNFSREKVDGTLIILNNTGLFNFSDLAWIRDTQKYIKYEHDYSFCRGRHAVHDCSKECPDTLEFYTSLFENALLSIFLSPAHRDVYLKYMSLTSIHLQPSPINVDRFQYTGPKENIYLAVGEDSWHKGSDLIKREFPNLVFLGGKNKVPYQEIHKYFNKAKYFVHKPRWIEPFGRTIAEAYCSSCELIVNDNIGFLSYPWDYSDRPFVLDQLRQAPNTFWKTISCFI